MNRFLKIIVSYKAFSALFLVHFCLGCSGGDEDFLVDGSSEERFFDSFGKLTYKMGEQQNVDAWQAVATLTHYSMKEEGYEDFADPVITQTFLDWVDGKSLEEIFALAAELEGS